MTDQPNLKKRRKGHKDEKNAADILLQMIEKYPNGDVYKGFYKVVNDV